ncbi:MAG TPA: RNA polymerase sporulation sigma factor SigH [Clostridiales bacterium]|nr:RNA polymerase sporulation sigma factor SigH [Clostridiales bacterium]
MIGSISMYSNLNYFKQEYNLFSDEELISKIKQGDYHAERCLYKRYTFIIGKITSTFFIIGGSSDDLMQEAMIGLIKAVKSFDAENGSSFKGYAVTCIRRQIITAIRKTKAYERISKLTSFYDCFSEDEESIYCEDSDLNRMNPENVLICREEENQYYLRAAELLSDFENTVLSEYEKGKTYEEISRALNKSIKSIDNALHRARKKIHRNKEKIMK